MVIAVEWYGLSLDAVGRVVVSVFLGGLIGLEREIDDQPAGLRTHISVCLGAALFGVISTLGFREFESDRASSNVSIDVSRVASQVVVGVGFIGAGMIFRQRGQVQNLTTAASLWVTAAVGLAAGVGDPAIAAVTAAGLLLALAALRVPRDLARRHFTREARTFRVGVAPGTEPAELLRALDDLPGVVAKIIGAEKHEGRIEYRIRIESSPGRAPEECVEPLVRRHDVELVSLDEATSQRRTRE